MSKKVINVGSTPNDGTGDKLRDAMRKINENFDEVYSGITSGTNGTSGSSGINGTSGSSGTNGTSGSSGTNGTSGSSGTNGTSGSSGISGTSGPLSGLTDVTITNPSYGDVLTFSGNNWYNTSSYKEYVAKVKFISGPIISQRQVLLNTLGDITISTGSSMGSYSNYFRIDDTLSGFTLAKTEIQHFPDLPFTGNTVGFGDNGAHDTFSVISEYVSTSEINFICQVNGQNANSAQIVDAFSDTTGHYGAQKQFIHIRVYK
jgi:hypothetical protein